MGFFQEIMEKPWETEGNNIINLKSSGEAQMPPAKISLMFLLCSMTFVFVLISIGYTYRLTLPDWRSLPDPGLLWINTAILFLSSFYLERARKSGRRGEIGKTKKSLIIAGLLTLIFLAGQLWVSTKLAEQGYYAAANPANAFFYMITWLHALHLFGGLIAWTRTMKKVVKGSHTYQIASSVELCAIYWHFLLIVWIGLFVLMVFS